MDILSLQEVSYDVTSEWVGDPDRQVTGVASLTEAMPGQLAGCASFKHRCCFQQTTTSAVLLDKKACCQLQLRLSILRRFFRRMLNYLFYFQNPLHSRVALRQAQ